MTKRMVLALMSVVGVFIALYLTLFKLGIIGELTCSVGSCETVQLSRWGDVLGLPVAAWGVGFYLAALVLALVSVQPRFEDSRAFSLALVALTGWGLLFSAWLTYLELFVIHAICMWCVISAIIVTLIFIVSVLDLRDYAKGEAVREDSSPSASPGDARGQVTRA